MAHFPVDYVIVEEPGKTKFNTACVVWCTHASNAAVALYMHLALCMASESP